MFIINGHGGHFWHVMWTIYINFRFPFTSGLNINFGFDGLSCSLEMVDRRTDAGDGRQSMDIL